MSGWSSQVSQGVLLSITRGQLQEVHKSSNEEISSLQKYYGAFKGLRSPTLHFARTVLLITSFTPKQLKRRKEQF